MQGEKSKVDAMEGILMARGTRKQVWGDAQESKKKRERELPKKQCVG